MLQLLFGVLFMLLAMFPSVGFCETVPVHDQAQNIEQIKNDGAVTKQLTCSPVRNTIALTDFTSKLEAINE